jgi:hypothetical protein
MPRFSYPKPKRKEPSMKTMHRWDRAGKAKSTDGCTVEPDGLCCHGHPSWLLVMGII